jgi:hypothetical protein
LGHQALQKLSFDSFVQSRYTFLVDYILSGPHHASSGSTLPFPVPGTGLTERLDQDEWVERECGERVRQRAEQEGDLAGRVSAMTDREHTAEEEGVDIQGQGRKESERNAWGKCGEETAEASFRIHDSQSVNRATFLPFFISKTLSDGHSGNGQSDPFAGNSSDEPDQELLPGFK